MQPVCLDTNILMWGIKKKARPEYQYLVVQAEALLDDLRKKRIPVVIPSIVTGEFLAHMPQSEHSDILALLQRHFMVVPFDLAASAWYAKLWLSKSREEKKAIAAEHEVTHAQLKADHMIVATALACNSSCIYSHDKHVKSFAKGYLPVYQMPNGATQPALLPFLEHQTEVHN